MLLIVALALCAPHFTICDLNYCGSEECNPSYEPVPNIFAAMVGYNILKGNPLSSENEIDPGLINLEYIFVPTTKNEQDRYYLVDGITVVESVGCHLKEEYEVISNAKQYQESLKKTSSSGSDLATNLEYDVSVTVPVKGAEVGVSTTVPPLATSAYAANKQVKNTESFFTKHLGVAMIATATCISYTLKISQVEPPPFHPGFIKMVSELQAATQSSDDGVKSRAFKKLMENFGTHYLRTAVMGSRIAVTEKLTREEAKKFSDEDVQKCSKESMSAIFGLIKSRSEKCSRKYSSKSSQTFREFSRRYTTTYGSKPHGDLLSWSNQDMEKPSPIRMTLDPIVNLFRNVFMGNLKDAQGNPIEYQNILKWLLPKYLSYCEDIKEELDIESCDLAGLKKKGCGINDDCHMDQDCKNDKSKPEGYYCVNPERLFQVKVITGKKKYGGTDDAIYIELVDTQGKATKSARIDNKKDNFERGHTDDFEIRTKQLMGTLLKIRFEKPGSDGWHLKKVMVKDVLKDRIYEFPCDKMYDRREFECYEASRHDVFNSSKKKAKGEKKETVEKKEEQESPEEENQGSGQENEVN